MNKYETFKTRLAELAEDLITDISQTVLTILQTDKGHPKTLTIDLDDEQAEELSTYVSVLICDTGECDIEQRERIATITPSPDGKTFTAKTEFSSIKKAEEMETDDLLSLQFGMQTAEMMVNKKKLAVMDGVLTTPDD